MRTRLWLLPGLAALLFALAPACDRPSELRIVAPADGDEVSSLAFDVVVQIHPNADAGSLEVRLNGQPLAMAGGPTHFTARVDPGPPLRDENRLEAFVDFPAGGERIARTHDFLYLPPKARALQIEDAADLPTGPLAHGRIGDFLLANERARFVVQDALPLQPNGDSGRDLHSVGTFGGNLIDAALAGQEGLDNFFEIQPAVNATTVLNAQSVEIVNDGQDGTAAVVRSCGPDDLIDYINAAAVVAEFGLPLPAAVRDVDHDLVGCTEYALAPGDRHVSMRTTIFNSEDQALTLVIGDYVNGMGTVEPFHHFSDGAGDFGMGGIGEPVSDDLSLLSYYGFGEAEGVSYSYVPLPIGVPNAPPSSFFGQSGVDFVITSNSVILFLLLGQSFFQVPPAVADVPGQNSWERAFGVGDGSLANGVDLMNDVRGFPTGRVEGRVTLGGSPVAGARVGLGVVDPDDPAAVFESLVTHWVTDADGRYSGTVPPGDYGLIAGLEGALYQGGGPVPQVNPVSVASGLTTTVQDVDLPAPGRLRVEVTDERGLPVPARVTMVGFDPSPDPSRFVPGLAGLVPGFRAGFLNDVAKDSLPFGVARVVYAGADGVAEFRMEPGDYELLVTRGTEYSSFRTPVAVAAGAPLGVEARIARVVDSPGFVSSDFHVHAINSPDSRISARARTSQFAGEGVDNLIMTEHDAHSDFAPVVAELGLGEFLHTTIGEEITTFSTGHFNGYPFTRDPAKPSGGSTDWAGAAPPGEDFPSKGSFNPTPAEVQAEAKTQPTATADTTVQINHFGSHFGPLKIDTSRVPPFSYLNAAERALHRFDPSSTANLFHAFEALEVWNGATRGAQNEFLDDRIGVWMNHLNQGLLAAAIADTDTHTFLNVRSGGARTWTPAPDGLDDPASLVSAHVAQSVRSGRAVGGQGLFVQARLRANDGSGGVADFRWGGSTAVSSTLADGVTFQVVVQAPLWASFDTIEIYRNAATVPSGFADVDPAFGVPGDEVPVDFGATPAVVLREGDCDPATKGDGDFDVFVTDVVPDVPGAKRRAAEVSVRFDAASATPETLLDGDSWFVAVVKGSDGLCPPMFPEMPFDLASSGNATLADLLDGNVGEGGVQALGFTNALFADVDGVPGFRAPLAP